MAFLKKIANGEVDRSEVAAFLFDPGTLLSTAKVTSDALANHFILAVDGCLLRQLSSPLIQLFVGQLRPNGSWAKAIDLLVCIGDVADQIVSGRNKWNRVSDHCGNKVSECFENVKGTIKVFLITYFNDKGIGAAPGPLPWLLADL